MKLIVQTRNLSFLPLTAGLILALAMPPASAAAGPMQRGVQNSKKAAKRPKKPAQGVTVVKTTFQKLDANQDGRVTAAESRGGRIPAILFDRHDADKNKSLSADEFVVLYKDLLVQANRPVAQDLVSEVARIQARRRMLKQETKKASTPKVGAVVPVKAVKAVKTADAVKPTSDIKSAKTAEPVPASPTGTADAATAEETAKRVEEARRKQADLDETRVREARIKAAQQAEARTKAARIKAAEQAAEARIRAARQKAAAGAGSDGTKKPRGLKGERIPGGKVKRLRRPVKVVTRHNGAKKATPKATPKAVAKPARKPVARPSGKPAPGKPGTATPAKGVAKPKSRDGKGL